MKGYIVSILIVGLALGGMGLGTFAWFTDTEIVKGNVIETGKADLDVWTTDRLIRPNIVPLKVENLVPSVDGWVKAGYIHLKNDGTVPLKWKGHFVLTNEDLELDDNFLFRFTKVSMLNSAAESTEWGITQDTVISDSTQLNFLDPKVYKWSEISNADNTALNWENFGGVMENWNPFTRILHVEVKLDENAGNCYAGKTAIFDVVFDATQTDNPGWSETSPTQ